jgi:cobalt/nickel transport protein
MTKSKKIIGITLMSVLLLIGLQVFIPAVTSQFTGTDDQSVELIQSIQPDYTPWFEQLELFSGEHSETILFALQCFIGLSIIAFYVIKKHRKTVKSY